MSELSEIVLSFCVLVDHVFIPELVESRRTMEVTLLSFYVAPLRACAVSSGKSWTRSMATRSMWTAISLEALVAHFQAMASPRR